MTNDSRKRILLTLKYLYDTTNEQHPATVGSIIAYLAENGVQAGRMSIYADIDLLINTGADIICNRRTQNQYHIGRRTFELPELKLLADAIESSHFITRSKSGELITKLTALINSHDAVQLNRRLYIMETAKPENERIYYSIDTLQSAIAEKRKVIFKYWDYTPHKKKVLKHDGKIYYFSPYAMKWNEDFYYAIGYSETHSKIVQFRIDKMNNVALTDLPAVESTNFDVTAFTKKIFGMYDDVIEPVRLICDNNRMYNIIDRFGVNVQTSIADDKHFYADVNVAPSPPFFAWVFTFAGAVRIVSPQSVINEMRGMATWLAD